jgi:hypothetical protein
MLLAQARRFAEEVEGAQPPHPSAAGGGSGGLDDLSSLAREVIACEADGPARSIAKQYFWLALGAGDVCLARACHKLLAKRFGLGLLELRHERWYRGPLHVLVTRHYYW